MAIQHITNNGCQYLDHDLANGSLVRLEISTQLSSTQLNRKTWMQVSNTSLCPYQYYQSKLQCCVV